MPITAGTLDVLRTGMAARYLEGRVLAARAQALRRSTRVALRFEAAGADYQFSEFADGNDNGIRTAELGGVDAALAPARSLRQDFADVSFGLFAGIPDLDGNRSAGENGVRIGASRILTLGPDGTATPGTLYVRGRRAQYAVRVFGATGRTRVLRYLPRDGRWVLQ